MSRLICNSNRTDLCLSPFVAFGWFYRYEGKLPSIRKVLCWLRSVWCGCKEKEKLSFNYSSLVIIYSWKHI